MAMAVSSQEQVEDQEQGEDQEKRAARQEIRLGLVMNGGVSLAIWMGGVTVEINRLINRDPVYGDVVDLMNSVVRVDVIAGASAGGINGAMLAAMIAHDNDRATELTTLRRIWLEDGAMARLFRPPLQKNPPSLMKGDEFFLPELRTVFSLLTDGPTTPKEDFPVRLTLTTTLLKAVNRGFADDFGSLIADADHRGEFNFRRGEDLDDDFDRTQFPEIADRLALASRCTASFPGAFEPSYVPVGRTPDDERLDPRRPDMKGFVNFSSSRFCVDGGALVNKPFRPAIRGIFAQPAVDEQVRRVLAYVVPDPDVPEADQPQERTEPQTMGKVVLASVVTLPRAESVSRELEDIAEHNRHVQSQRLLRDHLLAPGEDRPVDVEDLAVRLFPAFQTLRAQRIVDRLTTAADPFQGRFDGLGRAPWDTGELRRLIMSEPEPWLPSSFAEQTTLARTPWTWGNDTIETMGGIALGLIGMGFKVAGDVARSTLAEGRGRLHELLRMLRLFCLRPEPQYWKRQAGLTQEQWERWADLPPEESRDLGYRESFEDWRRGSDEWQEKVVAAGDPQPSNIALDIARVVAVAAPTLEQVARDPASGDVGPKLAALVEGLSPAAAEDRVEATLRRLLAQAIVQTVTSAGKPALDQLVELLQMSSTAPNGFDPRLRGEEKVAGRQLGHFGAFYKRSWRANDWMWGRLDGAARLAQMIVDPARLAQLDLSTERAFESLKAIALGPEGDEAHDVLADGAERGWRDEAARRELAFLDREGASPPESLPVCAMAVARRIQLRILQEELPGVADAIEVDVGEGARPQGPAADFLRAVRSVQFAEPRDEVRIGPRDASRLLSQCRVGDEKFPAEAGSDLFTSTTTTAAAIGVTALSGSTSGLPAIARAVVGALRTPTLGFWFLAQNAVAGTRTGFSLLILLLAVGGALVAVSALGDVALPGFLAGLGTLILLAGAAVALLRLKVKGVLAILVAVLVVVAFLWVPSVVVKQLIDADATGMSLWVRRVVPPAAAVIGFVLGGMVLGLVKAPVPKDERSLPGRRR